MTAATNLDHFRSLLKTVDPAALTNADNRALLLMLRASCEGPRHQIAARVGDPLGSTATSTATGTATGFNFGVHRDQHEGVRRKEWNE